ncbi:hypothetical protein SAMN04244573_01035 [Azotobacter beijerinckii]|uniref:Uncharacterized protein n=1 Tax=Azotobacter beijerinckii TaxID=170623 RepID=A0A1H9DB77_9GAMM|nr:hypothetical protein [Azotobacter beijerinckii]SEQ10735.1 hypothetical protein SAMN04244573_01035 [Azotobacter beijerinckii]
MPTPHSKPTTRYPVYLHPAAASNPSIIARIQRRTGLLVIAGGSRQAATLRPFAADLGPLGGAA